VFVKMRLHHGRVLARLGALLPSDLMRARRDEGSMDEIGTDNTQGSDPEIARLAETRRGGVELERNSLLAVHESDLETYLQSLGLLQDVRAGKIKCQFCGERLTLDRVAAVFPLGGSIKVACDRPACQAELLETVRQRLVRI
jgi:hypothetical protein